MNCQKIKQIIKYPLIRLVIAAILLFVGFQLAHAATLDGSSTSSSKIFKCQQTTIYANYSNFTDISAVTAMLLERDMSYTQVPMSGGGANWSGTYGNDNTTPWGNKSITFMVTKSGGGTYNNSSMAYVFVYSDDCTGTNIQGYKNVTYRTAGFGNYTRPLFSGQQNLLEFSIQPFLDYWGYTIYILILFTITIVIYIKNQSIAQPLIIAFISIAGLVGSNLIPTPYKNVILLLMGMALAAIFWRLFKSA